MMSDCEEQDELRDVSLYDAVCVLPRRRSDSKIGLRMFEALGWWLPVKKKDPNVTWSVAAEQLLGEISINAGTATKKVFRVYGVRISPDKPAVTRMVFLVDVHWENNSSDELRWFTLEDLHAKRLELLDLEVVEYASELLRAQYQDNAEGYQSKLQVFPDCVDYSADELIKTPFIVDDIGNPLRPNYESLFQAAQYGFEEQLSLCREFMNHCYPSLTMNYYSFQLYMMMKFSVRGEIYMSNLFRAFDFAGIGHIQYKDFVLAMAAFDSSTQHGGTSGEMRCRYIFRLYDYNSDNIMDYDEFRAMVSDVNTLKGNQLNHSALDAAVKEAGTIFGVKEGQSLQLHVFLTTVGQLKFRGTSSLFRAPATVLNCFPKSETCSQPTNESCELDTVHCLMFDDAGDSVKEDNDYTLATHCVKVKKSGTVTDANALWDFQGSCAMTRSARVPERVERATSVDCFSNNFLANEMMQGLRFFESKKVLEKDNTQLKKEALSWGSLDRMAVGQCLMSICRMVHNILINEDRLVQVSSPAYILGDIHGNYQDLLCFEKTFFRLGIVLSPANFVFLGDYVDRGSYGVEVIAHLFAQKILAPKKVFLLRGNHEIRSLQRIFTFYKECLNKFGDKMGENIWSAINNCFDVMPLAAVIDNKVFCVHGGIPPPWALEGKISNINNIPIPLQDPEKASPLAWEMMWNDPISKDQMVAECPMMLKGFCANSKRGTAHCFSSEALENFLSDNNLSFVVRAHEVQQVGFQLQQNGKLLTVFSSSKYCGGNNDAACIFVDNCKIRVIRLDTS